MINSKTEAQLAISFFKHHLEGTLKYCERPSIYAAIKALEKQIPKELKKTLGYEATGKCPVCDFETIIDPNFKYCPECGQRIDWGKK